MGLASFNRMRRDQAAKRAKEETPKPTKAGTKKPATKKAIKDN